MGGEFRECVCPALVSFLLRAGVGPSQAHRALHGLLHPPASADGSRSDSPYHGPLGAIGWEAPAVVSVRIQWRPRSTDTDEPSG